MVILISNTPQGPEARTVAGSVCALAEENKSVLDPPPLQDVIIADMEAEVQGSASEAELYAHDVEVLFGDDPLSCALFLVTTIQNDRDAYATVRKLVYHPSFPYHFFFLGGKRVELAALCGVDNSAITRISSLFIEGLCDQHLNNHLELGNFIGVLWEEQCPDTRRSYLMETVGVVAPQRLSASPDTVPIFVIPDNTTEDRYGVSSGSTDNFGLKVVHAHVKQTFVPQVGPSIQQYLLFLQAFGPHFSAEYQISTHALRFGRGSRFDHNDMVKIIAGEFYGHTAVFDRDASVGYPQHQVVLGLYTHEHSPLTRVVLPASYVSDAFSAFDRVVYDTGDTRVRAYIKPGPRPSPTTYAILIEETAITVEVGRSSLKFARTTAVC